MTRSSFKIYFWIPVLAILMQSCFVAKEYKRPEGVVDAELFRTDKIAEDSVSMAEISWRDMFTDPILEKHIDTALKNNMDVRIALQQILIAEAYMKQGRAGYFPTINAHAQMTHQELSGNSQFSSFFNSLNQFELAASLSWEADIWGKIRSQKRASAASYLQSVAAHQAVKTRLIADVANTYYQLLALDEQLRVTETTVETRKKSLETTYALKDAGNLTEVGVKQTEAQLYTAQAIMVDLQNQIRLLENAFSILLGESPHAIERSNIDEESVPEEFETGVPVKLLSNRPDVMAAEYNLINAFELTNVARSNFYPSLTLSATSGFQSLEFKNWLSPESLFLTVVGGLTQPIFNQRRIRTQYEVAKADQQIAVLNFRQTILTAGREVSDALSNLQASDSIIAIRGREYAAYEKATDYSEELLNNGLANYLEVLNARENALNSQLQLIENRRRRLNALVNLYEALGGGWR